MAKIQSTPQTLKEELKVVFEDFPPLYFNYNAKDLVHPFNPEKHKRINIMIPAKWPGPAANLEQYRPDAYIDLADWEVVQKLWSELPKGFFQDLKQSAKDAWEPGDEDNMRYIRDYINHHFLKQVAGSGFERKYVILLLAKIRYRIGKEINDNFIK